MADNTKTNDKPMSQLSFNMIGLEPTSCSFVWKKEDAEKVLFELASEALNDGDPSHDVVRDSTMFAIIPGSEVVEYDRVTKQMESRPRIAVQVMIPAGNRNISAAKGNLLIRPEEITQYSDKFINFVNAYCDDDHRVAYKYKGTRNRFIVIDGGKFFGRIFDKDAYAYKEAYGKNVSVDYVHIQADPIWTKNSNGKITGFEAFLITKSYQKEAREKLVFDVFQANRKKDKRDRDRDRDDRGFKEVHNGFKEFRNDFRDKYREDKYRD